MSRRKNHIQNIEADIIINYLNERGYGVGTMEGKQIHVLNALPSEKIKVSIFKKRKKVFYANAIEIIEPADYRIEEKEDHYLSCSPWQIMPINKENEFKQMLIKSLFLEYAAYDLKELEIDSINKEYSYRNKVEFSFYGFDDETVSLAFHKRETRYYKTPTKGCVLMPDEINNSAQKIVEFINMKNIRARSLKGLLLRYSFSQQKVIACIFSKEELNITQNELSSLLDSNLKGIFVINSDPKSPAFVETEITQMTGDNILEEKLLNMTFEYSYNGFFQINPPAFENALKDIVHYCSSIPNSLNLIASDLYSGVGTIGISISPFFKSVIGVEITVKTKDFAMSNARKNNINNFLFIEGKTEKEGLELLKSDVVVLDPPRAGLHPKVISKIAELKPNRIIYLSCNPKTQAEDFLKLKDLYTIKFIKAYNFYPHTPHIENLMILERKLYSTIL